MLVDTSPSGRGSPQDWRTAVQDAVAEGFTYLDLLTAVDRGSGVELVCHLVRRDDHGSRWIRTLAADPDPQLPTVTDVLPAASWHEREVQEMFGVQFTGAADSAAPLLLTEPLSGYPLRKSEWLAARQDRPWPGEAEPGGRRSRRRHLPPGVQDRHEGRGDRE